jgi:hypothetical protein
MAVPTADQAAARWAANLGAATTRIQQGVQAVSVAPGTAAARQKTVWQQNTTAAADKWATNVAKVDLGSWQQDTINKGIPRIASGASAAQPKFSAFMSQFLPYVQSQQGSLPPRGNLQANIQRMVSWTNAMAQFKKR